MVETQPTEVEQSKQGSGYLRGDGNDVAVVERYGCNIRPTEREDLIPTDIAASERVTRLRAEVGTEQWTRTPRPASVVS